MNNVLFTSKTGLWETVLHSLPWYVFLGGEKDD